MNRMTKKLEAALEWAAAGFYIFPCAEGTKVPLISGKEGGRGLYDATTDAGQIRKWWAKCPEANIGVAPAASGHYVLDVDDKENKHGSDTLRELEFIHGDLPGTFTVETPTGGRHHWFKGDEASSVERLGPGLDIRGRGGYVLLPGSEVEDGRYTTIRSGSIAEGPVQITMLLHATTRDRESSITDELDTSPNIGRAVAFLRDCVTEGDVAVEGEGGNETTYRIAAMLHDIGVSDEMAIELILEHWNDHCEPPWTESELTDETHSPVYHAYTYAQNEAGSKGVRDNQANFTGILRDGLHVGISSATDRQDPGNSRFKLRSEAEQDTRPDPVWIVPGWVQEASTILLYGPPNSYKSFAALDIALSFAAGKKALGIDYQPDVQCPVVYAAGEGAIGIEKLRRPAYKAHRRVSASIPFYSVSDVPTAGEDPSEIDEFVEQIEAVGIRPTLIVFDTLSRMLSGLDENSAKDASLAVKRVEEIKRIFNCVVLVVHHTGKDGKSERGSSAFRGGFDTLISCEREGDGVVLTCIKQKDAQEPRPHTMQAIKVGKSIALSPTEVKEELHKDEDKRDDFARERNIIRKVLTEGGHVDRGSALSSKALAVMYLREAGEMPENPAGATAAVEAKKNALNRKAKGVLRSYVVSDFGDTPQWALSPEP